MEAFRLPDELAAALCHRLGVAVPTDLDGLDPLYRAWCALVPTDNVAKELALAEGRIPPGDDPVEVVEHYLATGLGGTCWAHVSALAGVLGAAGARATVGLDRMVRTDGIVDFHSFVIVHDGDARLVLDPVWVSGPPLPLRAGVTGDHPVIATGFEADGDGGGDDDDAGQAGRLWHWSRVAEGGELRYAVLSTVLDRDDVRSFCALSARFSGVPFGVLQLRRTLPEATEKVRCERDGDGADRPVMWVTRRTAGGSRDERATDPDAAFAAVGCGPEARRLAERAGLLG
jgi:hypothetical protein